MLPSPRPLPLDREITVHHVFDMGISQSTSMASAPAPVGMARKTKDLEQPSLPGDPKVSFSSFAPADSRSFRLGLLTVGPSEIFPAKSNIPPTRQNP